MAGRVAGKIAIITGAGSGIGRACMTLFAREGAKVAGISRTQSAVDETLRIVRAEGGDGLVVAGDLSKPEGSRAIIDATMKAYGRIDILVNAASVGWSWSEKSLGSMNDIAATSDEKWREVIGLNLDSCFFICREVINIMRKQGGGAIVNVGSISGMLGMTTAHTYTAAKGAVINLTRSIAVTYAADNIRANCVAPGYTDTPMIAAVMGAFDDKKLAASLTPMARAGKPEEMAYPCLWLASDEASYCNGILMPVDGGKHCWQFNG